MKSIRQAVAITASLLLQLGVASQATAQNATVTLGSQKQYIRGFGGMSHAEGAS